MTVIVGVGLVALVFYGLLSNRILGATIAETLGPYSDTLAEYGLRSPEIWQGIAQRHGVAIVYEPVDGQTVAFDDQGNAITPDAPLLARTQVRSTRTSARGDRVTFYWTSRVFRLSHLPMLAGTLAMLTLVVGSVFWFLQRQLRPLTRLRDGVDAVAAGDFDARVPVARNDEIGQVAAAFNTMAGRVGEMMDDRERLLADVSHELRSPLARMKVALELTPEGDKRDALARDLAEMSDLIAVLLEREALRSRSGSLDAEDVDLTALVADVVDACADSTPRVTFASAAAVTIRADPALLRLLVQNLVDNAVKFSLPDSRPVEVRLDRDADAVTLRVLDDGPGIPSGSEERVFEPFVKLDKARGHGGGYGLGLDLCRRIANLHGGTVRLVAREPRGTEAVATLPR